jgi:hypothetical protein
MPFGFGRKSIEEQLSETGQRAKAEVLSSEPTKHFDSSYGTELNGRRWILAVRVQPPDEPSFEVELHASLKVLLMPRAGDWIDVLYDPGDHSRTVIDPALDLAPRRHSHSEIRAEVTLPKGQEAIAQARTAPLEHRAELERFARFYAQGALSDDEYQELRRRILGLPEPTVVAAVFQRRRGQVIVSVEREADVPGPDPGAPGADPLDGIKRLAELRDSGALSDEEFEARKRELLEDV